MLCFPFFPPPLSLMKVLCKFLAYCMMYITIIHLFYCLIKTYCRHQLNLKKSKVNDYPIRKSSTYSAHHLATHLANSSINDDLKDDACPRKMSKSLIGGSLNACKRRVLTFMLQDRTPQGLQLCQFSGSWSFV